MGTRSVTIIMDEEGYELVRIYRQYDGYPDGHGVELAELCDRKITNGITGVRQAKPAYVTSNTMRELAAHVLCELKARYWIGNIYLDAPNEKISAWAEYIYRVSGKQGEVPVISCETHVDEDGPSMFNPKQSEGLVFSGTPAEWREQYPKGTGPRKRDRVKNTANSN